MRITRDSTQETNSRLIKILISGGSNKSNEIILRRFFIMPKVEFACGLRRDCVIWERDGQMSPQCSVYAFLALFTDKDLWKT